MAYTILPGIRQDHRGRFYKLAIYPNGKTIIIDTPGASAMRDHEQARMIPIVEPAARHVRSVIRLRKLTNDEKRIAIVETRHEPNGHVSTFAGTTADAQHFVDHTCRPLMWFDGESWHPFGGGADWHVCYHKVVS